MELIAYARVSTSGQTLDAQLEQLRSHGCDLIFQETMSGARADDRPQLRKALAVLGKGDTLLVTRLDRLARSTFDLLTIVREIEAKGARLKSLADSWADTTTPTGRLILTVLGGLAEFERSLIHERTSEGRELQRGLRGALDHARLIEGRLRPRRKHAAQQRSTADWASLADLAPFCSQPALHHTRARRASAAYCGALADAILVRTNHARHRPHRHLPAEHRK